MRARAAKIENRSLRICNWQFGRTRQAVDWRFPEYAAPDGAGKFLGGRFYKYDTPSLLRENAMEGRRR